MWPLNLKTVMRNEIRIIIKHLLKHVELDMSWFVFKFLELLFPPSFYPFFQMIETQTRSFKNEILHVCSANQHASAHSSAAQKV